MKQITITVPDNCELKQDGNTYIIVEKEKEKQLTYEDIARELFSEPCCYINSAGNILAVNTLSNYSKNLNNCKSTKQAEKLLAINKLMNVAKYLNDGWQPDWDNMKEPKYFIRFNTDKSLDIDYVHNTQLDSIFFKSRELAQQAIEILGEETMKLIFCTDY